MRVFMRMFSHFMTIRLQYITRKPASIFFSFLVVQLKLKFEAWVHLELPVFKFTPL